MCPWFYRIEVLNSLDYFGSIYAYGLSGSLKLIPINKPGEIRKKKYYEFKIKYSFMGKIKCFLLSLSMSIFLLIFLFNIYD